LQKTEFFITDNKINIHAHNAYLLVFLSVLENGKELLSMNDVMLYLMMISKPLVDKKDLPFLLTLENSEWNKFVDSFRHVIVTWPGMVSVATSVAHKRMSEIVELK